MEQFLFTPRLRSVATSLCPSCLRRAHQTLTIRPGSRSLQNGPSIRTRSRHTSAHIASEDQQANPLDGYYAELLSHPTSTLSSTTHSPLHPPPPAPSTRPSTRDETLAKARIVFGSRLAGPAARRDELQRKSVEVAGVLVPPRPDEPDNCCMSGCVNCVWDRYRDELEEWAAKSAAAREALRARRRAKGEGERSAPAGRAPGMAVPPAVSMDDDGGSSEALWSTPTDGTNTTDLFKDIPVGIREFMRTEKLLKQRHVADAATPSV